jgi:hypothetical protein
LHRILDRRNVPWLALCLALVVLPAASSGPVVVEYAPGTDQPVGWLRRTDAGFPFGIDANADRAACMMDPRVVSTARLKEMIREARRDRVVAYRHALRLTGACMKGKGWEFVACGAPGEAACPASVAEDDPEHRD